MQPSLPLKDIAQGFQRHELVRYLALDDLRQRYARTLLGPFWIVISSGIWIFSIGFVSSKLFGADLKAYFPFVATGMISFIYLSTSINEGVTTLIQYKYFVQNTEIPYSVYFYRGALRNLLVLLHYAPIMLGIYLVCHVPIGVGLLLVIPAILLVTLFCLGVSVTLGFLTARYRDLQQLATTVLNLLSILTPVIWMPSTLPPRYHWIADINPLYHLMTIMRSSLLGQIASPLNWSISAIAAGVSMLVGLLAFIRYRKLCAFWL